MTDILRIVTLLARVTEAIDLAQTELLRLESDNAALRKALETRHTRKPVSTTHRRALQHKTRGR